MTHLKITTTFLQLKYMRSLYQLSTVDICVMKAKLYYYFCIVLLFMLKDAKTHQMVTKSKSFSLPWWFCIICWVLLVLVVLASSAFVTFYGITFQDDKCKKWITSMLISFTTSIFITEPLKVSTSI